MSGIINQVGARSGIISGGGSASAGTVTLSGTKGLTYEEGDWTPTIEGGTLTKTQYSATYTKIGRLVTIQSYWEGNNNGDSTGLTVGGIPYTATAGDVYTVGCLNYSAQNSGETADCTCRIVQNGTTIFFSRNPQVHLPQTAVDHNHFIFSLTYFAA